MMRCVGEGQAGTAPKGPPCKIKRNKHDEPLRRKGAQRERDADVSERQRIVVNEGLVWPFQGLGRHPWAKRRKRTARQLDGL